MRRSACDCERSAGAGAAPEIRGGGGVEGCHVRCLAEPVGRGPPPGPSQPSSVQCPPPLHRKPSPGPDSHRPCRDVIASSGRLTPSGTGTALGSGRTGSATPRGNRDDSDAPLSPTRSRASQRREQVARRPPTHAARSWRLPPYMSSGGLRTFSGGSQGATCRYDPRASIRSRSHRGSESCEHHRSERPARDQKGST